MINVLDYGATGNGITDDYIAINNAIIAAANKTLFFPYTGNFYKFGTNLIIPANVNLVFEKGAMLSPAGVQTITYSGFFGQPTGIYASNISAPANVPASLAGAAQFLSADFASGGAGTSSIFRVARYSAAQTGGGGTEGVMALNLLGQQNSADAIAQVTGLEIDFNNNKSDDPLTPTAANAHYALNIWSGGSHKVGPAAIAVGTTAGLTNAWQRGIWFKGLSIAPGGYAFDYDGNGTGNPVVITDAGLMGIGTVGPMAALDIQSSNSAGLLNLYSNVNQNLPVSIFKHAFATGGQTATMAEFLRADGTVEGTITTTTSGTAYNTSSDYRLKDDPQPLTGSGAFIDSLLPKTWKWKIDGSHGAGFVAHEVQAVSPSSVVGEKDGATMQAMEYGSAEFIANIIAELQALRKRVAILERE